MSIILHEVGDYDHEPYQHQDDANHGPGLDPSRHSGQRVQDTVSIHSRHVRRLTSKATTQYARDTD